MTKAYIVMQIYETRREQYQEKYNFELFYIIRK